MMNGYLYWNNMNSKVILYTDGAYSRLRDVGSYGFIAQYLIYNKQHELYELKKEASFSKRIEGTTNNRMELLAAIEGINFVKKPSHIEVISDATYVVNTINIWLEKFIKDPNRLNGDLMKELHQAVKKHKSVKGVWVRGHNNHIPNERINELVQREAGTWKGR